MAVKLKMLQPYKGVNPGEDATWSDDEATDLIRRKIGMPIVTKQAIPEATTQTVPEVSKKEEFKAEAEAEAQAESEPEPEKSGPSKKKKK